MEARAANNRPMIRLCLFILDLFGKNFYYYFIIFNQILRNLSTNLVLVRFDDEDEDLLKLVCELCRRTREDGCVVVVVDALEGVTGGGGGGGGRGANKDDADANDGIF